MVRSGNQVKSCYGKKGKIFFKKAKAKQHGREVGRLSGSKETKETKHNVYNLHSEENIREQ